MTFVLSIIAKPSEDRAATTSDGNVAIDAIVRMMTRTSVTRGYDTRVERATYVRDIALKLRELKNEGRTPDIIQIIGHGSAGRLELGSYWTQSPLDPRLGPAVLDSNPDSYGMLVDTISAPSRLFLLGCSVGSKAPNGYVASGSALLFDIEDMTGANVYASDDLVYPELFDDSFLYNGSLVTSNGKPANPAALVLTPLRSRSPDPSPGVADTSTPHPVPRLTSLLSARALGLASELKAELPVDAAYFADYVLARPQPGRLLAMAELVFSASNYRRVEAICCLRYLRAETDDGTAVYFEPPPRSGPGRLPPADHFEAAAPVLEALRASALAACRT
jgi:hypothetical protein